MSESSRATPRPAVAHINLARGFRGGENQTLLLVRELAARGWRQQFIGRRGEPLAERLAGTPGLVLSQAGGVVGAGLAVRAPIVHAHEARAAQAAWLASRLRGARYLLTRRVMKPPSGSWLTSRVYRDAAAIVALSRAIAAVLLERFPGQVVIVVPSALSVASPDAARVEEIRRRYPGNPVIGNVAALDVAKGQLELIEAVGSLRERLPGLACVLVGTGPDEAEIRRAAAGLPRVHFTGFVDNVADYLAAMDVFVFPSHHEGLGSVLLQAMAAGLPIVASDTGGIPELISNEQNGLLVPVRDAPALAAAIERLAGDEPLRRRLADAARAGLDRYRVDAIADRYELLYHELGD